MQPQDIYTDAWSENYDNDSHLAATIRAGCQAEGARAIQRGNREMCLLSALMKLTGTWQGPVTEVQDDE